MTDQSMLDSTSGQTATPTNPQEIALQSLCKQLLKSQKFRGIYLERHYVANIKGYRDVICLPQSEKSLEKMLRDIRDKLEMFYNYQNHQMWIGITSGTLKTPPPSVLDTCLWVEIKDLPFGQYMFTIKSLRFRANEIILKLKAQPIDEEDKDACNKSECDKSQESQIKQTVSSQNTPTMAHALNNQVTFDDFILLLVQWSTSLKQTVYNFLSEDISKESIKNALRFFGLLVVSVISGTFVGVQFLGVFTINFMRELSRLTHVLTPIMLKIIDVFSKIIGGFYILLAMIWKDVVSNRNQPKNNALEYNSSAVHAIQYEQRQRRLGSSPTAQYSHDSQF